MQDHTFYYDSIQYNGTNKLKRLYKDHKGRFSWEEIGLIIRIAACKESVDHYQALDLGFSSEFRRANRAYKKACRDLYRLRKSISRQFTK
jgi:hypothetical protein